MHFVVKQISGAFSSCKTEYLYPLNNNYPFLPLPRPSQSHSTFCFQESNLNTSYEWVRIVFVFWWLVFHWCSPYSSMLQHVTTQDLLLFFLNLNLFILIGNPYNIVRCQFLLANFSLLLLTFLVLEWLMKTLPVW